MVNMNKNLLSFLVGALLVSSPALADEDDLLPNFPGEFSFNVALTTDYISVSYTHLTLPTKA